MFDNTGDYNMVTAQASANGKTGSTQELLAQIEALKAENAKLKEARNAKISFKVSEKGPLSCYGMGRWPVTFYRGQWERTDRGHSSTSSSSLRTMPASCP